MSNLESVLQTLQSHSTILDGEQLGDLKALLDGLKHNISEIQEKDRNLRIAVIGQMKAGKSSFLNAAFFNRDLLPKADTPMTAALTKIVYAPKARAEVEFYSKDDWDGIEQRAREYDQRYKEEEAKLIDESKSSAFAKPRQPSKHEIESRISETLKLKSSLELVNKAKEQSLDVRSYLGKKEELTHIDGAAAMAQALHEYVGSGGRYTAITKMTVLYVDDPRLEGLEIIDTPGFNDPVVSRGQTTRSYLAQCDVIFLLSSLSQFITSSDMSVLREQLSEAGIDEKAIFLVGSQRDIALRQDPNIAKTASTMAERFPVEQRAGAKVAAMMQLLDKQMGEYARNTLDAQINKPGMDDKTRRILGAVRQAQPRFISAWSWLIAENFTSLSKDDKEQFNSLCRDTGYTFNADSMRQLSNIPAVREDVLKQRERKNELIAGKEQALREGVLHSTGERLKQMREGLLKRSEQIRNGNIADLAKSEQDTIKRLTAGRAKLEDIFDEQLHNTKTQFALLKTDVREQAQKYSRLETVTETKTESYEKKIKRKLFRPSTWPGGYETRYRDVVTVYASAQDAIEQVETFAIKITKELQTAIVECVNLEMLRRNVGQAAMSLFDTGSAEFDGELMLAEVNKSMRKITIPDVAFGNKDYSQSILKSFGSGNVSEGKINGLKEAQRAAVAAIIADLGAEVDRKVKEISQSLETTSKSFVENMSRDIHVSLSRLREDIANKEKSIHQIDQALLAVDKCLASL